MNQKFNVKGLALTAALVWAGGVFFVGAGNLVKSTYGAEFLRVMASIYPGYDGTPSITQLIILVLYGLVDGAVCGFLFGWLYNFFAED